MIKEKIFCIWLFGWLAVVAASASSGYADASIRFKDNAVILPRVYTMGDIVVFEPKSSHLEDEFAMVQIGRTPRPGQTQQITRFEIDAVLESIRPGISQKLQWRGPNYLRIRGGGVQCDMYRLQLTALKYLQTRLREKYEQATVRTIDEPDPVVVAAGEVSLHPKISSARPLARRMPVWVDIRVDGQHFQTLPVWFAVSVRQPVWVLNNNMAAKAEPAPEDLVRCVKDIAGLSGNPISAESLKNMRIIRKMSAGAILTTADVEPIPAVRQGDLITVYANHGSVQLRIKAVAMADGRLSQQIAVKNPGSGQSFRARVIGNRKAMVN